MKQLPLEKVLLKLSVIILAVGTAIALWAFYEARDGNWALAFGLGLAAILAWTLSISWKLNALLTKISRIQKG